MIALSLNLRRSQSEIFSQYKSLKNTMYRFVHVCQRVCVDSGGKSRIRRFTLKMKVDRLVSTFI